MTVKNSRVTNAIKVIENAQTSGRKILLPNEAMDVIKSSGISTPAYALARTVNEAVSEAKSMGFPVVLKIASPDVLHKSDTGGVVINVEDEEEVEKRYDEIISNLTREIPAAEIMGILVEKQVSETTEVIVGGVMDEQFGPTVMFGLGGIFVELFKDVAFRIAPVTEDEVLEMIKEIKGYSLLKGYRGSKRLDIQELAKAIVTVSELISDTDVIKEVELNPLLVYTESVIAVDARIIIK